MTPTRGRHVPALAGVMAAIVACAPGDPTAGIHPHNEPASFPTLAQCISQSWMGTPDDCTVNAGPDFGTTTHAENTSNTDDSGLPLVKVVVMPPAGDPYEVTS